MNAKIVLSIAVWITLAVTGWSAPKPEKSEAELQKIIDGLKWQTGDIPLNSGIASIKLKDGFRYLDGSDSAKVMTDIFGNPPSKRLGMIFPPGQGVNVPWAFIIENFSAEGYVKDEDAEKLDADKLLKDIQDGQKEDNERRKSEGYPELEIVGWAVPPHYDKEAKKLYWALDIKRVGADEHSVNYFVRVLGRKGYFEILGLAPLDQIKTVEAATPRVLSMIEFTEGNRYADYNSKTDKVAAYGIAGLIAAGIGLKLAKLGLFAVLLKKFGVLILLLKKGFIVVVAAFAALFNKIKSFFTGRKSTTADEPPPSV